MVVRAGNAISVEGMALIWPSETDDSNLVVPVDATLECSWDGSCLTDDSGDYSTQILIAVTAVLGAFMCCGSVYAIFKFVKKSRSLARTVREQETQQVRDALDMTMALEHPAAMMRADDFMELGGLIPYEEVRDLGLHLHYDDLFHLSAMVSSQLRSSGRATTYRTSTLNQSNLLNRELASAQAAETARQGMAADEVWSSSWEASLKEAAEGVGETVAEAADDVAEAVVEVSQIFHLPSTAPPSPPPSPPLESEGLAEASTTRLSQAGRSRMRYVVRRTHC